MKRKTISLLKIILIVISFIILSCGFIMNLREDKIIKCNRNVLQMYGDQETNTLELLKHSTESLYLKLNEIQGILYCYQYTLDKKSSSECEKIFSDLYGDMTFVEWQKTYSPYSKFIESNETITKKILECNKLESNTNWPFLLLIVFSFLSVVIHLIEPLFKD